MKFEQISLEQGLSQSVVTCILQDRQGFMWFGTMDGLNKYDGYRFLVYKHDSQDPGSLASNHITALCEDSAGTMWVGSPEGLHRFDRVHNTFVRYQHDESNTHSLSHNGITAILPDRRASRLWVGTAGGGLNLLDTQTGNFAAYVNDPQQAASLPGNYVQALSWDRAGVLWIGTRNGLAQLTHFGEDNQPVSFARFQHEARNSSSLSNNLVWTIHEDRLGELWVATFGGGANKLDRATGQFKVYHHDSHNAYSLSDNVVRPIYEDREGRLWFGTGLGLSLYDRTHDHFICYQHDPADARSLSNNDVWSIYQDRSGTLWFGTYGGGLSKFNSARQKFEHYAYRPNEPHSLAHNMVMSIAEDHNGTLWIGTGGGGLYQVMQHEPHETRFRRYAHDPGDRSSLSNDGVAALCAGHYRGAPALWVGTGEGLHRMTAQRRFVRYQFDPRDPQSLSNNGVSVIFESPRTGKLWVGTGAGGLNQFVSDMRATEGTRRTEGFVRIRHDPANPNSLGSDVVYALAETSVGEHLYLWIGTARGLDRFEQSSGVFTHLGHETPAPKNLSNNQVLAICVDPDSTGPVLWLGTAGGGLNLFNAQRGTVTVFTEREGLPNGVIYAILDDGHGALWLSTNNGLSRFSKATRRFRNYTMVDGLQSAEFNQGAFLRSSRGEMFFGGINGFNRFYPDQIHDNPYAPPVVLTSFKKLDKEVKLDSALNESSTLNLSYQDYFISFAFAALDFTDPPRNQYAYRLEGFDEDWVYCGTRRYTSYTNLEGGHYVFRVKGANSDGVWNEQGMAIHLLVTPPFWKTWWFLSGAVLLLTGSGILLHRRRLRQRLEKARLANELQAAHDMQMRLMPARAPQIPGFDLAGVCRPAEEVGGDFFDYIWLDENKSKLGIVLVDVSDKAIAGAMTAVLTSGMISSEVATFRSPRLLLRRINRTMYRKTDSHVFTAMCFAIIDLANQTLTFANAGQTEPLLLREGQIQYLKVEGLRLPLGLQRQVDYNETTLPLKTSDLLVFYTDGLTDAMDARQESFGYERLEKTLRQLSKDLRAQDIINALLHEVDHFTAGTRQYDDITLVVAQCTKG